MSRKRFFIEQISTFVERTERVILGIGAIALLLWLIEPIRARVEHVIGDKGVVAICALAILYVLRTTERLSDRIDHFVAAEERSVIPDGIVKVYQELDDALERLADRMPPRFGNGRRSLDILGITLFTAWDHLQPQLKKRTFCDWEVTFACISPEFAKREPAVPAEWADALPGRIRDITDFIKKNKAELEQRNVTVRLFLYEHLPAVHGFHLEPDDLFCSYIHWEGEELAKPFQFYEHFPTANRSPRAMEYRALFANWLERAHGKGAVPVT